MNGVSIHTSEGCWRKEAPNPMTSRELYRNAVSRVGRASLPSASSSWPTGRLLVEEEL